MAKKNNEIKENIEEVKEITEEVVNEEIEENNEVVEDAKTEENASNTEEDAEMPLEEKLTVKESFKDKYNDKVLYNPGDIFVVNEEIEDKKPVEVEKGKYNVSKERYEELQRSLYVD